MGYWDDNKELEFLLPNGTFLAPNSSQARIHYEFGQQCKLFLILELAIIETNIGLWVLFVKLSDM